MNAEGSRLHYVSLVFDGFPRTLLLLLLKPLQAAQCVHHR
jgi:hypothetical protein